MSNKRLAFTAIITIMLTSILLLTDVLCFYKVIIVGGLTFLALNVISTIINYIKKRKTLRELFIELLYIGILCLIEIVIIMELLNLLLCFKN